MFTVVTYRNLTALSSKSINFLNLKQKLTTGNQQFNLLISYRFEKLLPTYEYRYDFHNNKPRVKHFISYL
jgi:hypothetical protein